MSYEKRSLMSIALLSVVFMLVLQSCESEKAVDPREQAVIDETEELFMRSKVLDYEVLYENEYPYMRDELDLETYLKNRYIQYGRIDTLMALQIDSVTLYDDSARAHLQLEYVLADSSINLTTVPLFWYEIDDTDWVHPTLSNLTDQLDYEEEIRVYWEAVRKMQEKEKEKAAEDSATADDQ